MNQLLKSKFKSILSVCTLVIIGFSCKNVSENALFTKLNPLESGIHFSNRITENDTMNIISFEYIYNGGGVALGDFNNDKKIDVFFTGNQVENKLYLNQGKNKNDIVSFKDITKTANVSGNGKWCTGATVVDINNDGLLDIYVSASIKKVASERANLLYINQGLDKNNQPNFKEMATEYGIADTTHTTNSVFFDYDNDGDLDLYVLVDEMADIHFPNMYHQKIIDGSSPITDRLYRNDWDEKAKHPIFTNVSKQEGILIEGFGLGVNITDINRDGWKDIYVTNDYLTNDLLYINQHKNGKHIGFEDQAATYFKHTSHSAMGNDVEDINNDGLVDFFALDMMPAENSRKKTMIMANNYLNFQNNDKFGYTYQYPRNTLQLNRGQNPKTGQPIFSEIGILAGLAESDWSWTPMLTDFDNDGLRDVIITNGFPKDITDLDFMAYRSSTGNYATPSYLMEFIPSVKLKNFAFKNLGNLKFEDVTDRWGITEPSFSNGAAYADLDNDGDLDYVVNNINDSASVYINNARKLYPDKSNYLNVYFKGEKTNQNGIGAWVEIFYNKNQKQVYEATPYRGYLSTIEQMAHFGLGAEKNIDSLLVIWPSGKRQILKNVKVNQNLILNEANATEENILPIKAKNQIFTDISEKLKIPFVHDEEEIIDFNIQKLIPHKFSESGPKMAVGDINGDKLEDVFISGSTGRKGSFLIQDARGNFNIKDLLPGKNGIEKPEEDTGALFFDFDNDNDLDLYIVSGSNEAKINSVAYQDRLYVNDGKGNFSLSINVLPKFLKSGSCVKSADYDKDGDLDLFVGTQMIPNQYPKPATNYILRNEYPQLKFTNVSTNIAPILTDIGLINDAVWADIDNDTWPDLVLAGEWMPIAILKNVNGSFKSIAQSSGLENYLGWWSCIATGDFDNDGDLDFVAGNLGQNTLHRATNKTPTQIYAGDFNADGNYDAIPTVFFKDKSGEKNEYTFNSRDDLIKQFIQTRARFKSYADFGNATINDILLPTEIKNAYKLKTNWLNTSYIENLGNGKFKMKSLPIESQFSKVTCILPLDINKDGKLDLIISGNDYGNEVSTGRLDASIGTVYLGNGLGNFQELSINKSGILLDGNSKDLKKVNGPQNSYLLINSQNRGPLKIFKRN